MTLLQEISSCFIHYSFIATIISNTTLILLTIFQVRDISPAYRKLVIIFALLGITYASLESIAKPFLHNFNASFMMFSMNDGSFLSPPLVRLSTVLLAVIFGALLCVLAMQFGYRYLVLSNSKHLNKSFGKLVVASIVYVIFVALTAFVLYYFFAMPDEFTMRYLSEEIRKVYGKNVSELEQTVMLPYTPESGYRWKNIACLIGSITIISFQYIIMMYCGYQMKCIIQKKLSHTSLFYQRLERQLFNALVVQLVLPTIFLTFPSGIVFFLPLLGLEISLQTGGLIILYSLHAPLDSFLFMCIMEEYGRRLRGTVSERTLSNA